MKLAERIVRRWKGLPPARCEVEASRVWVPATDGARLATEILRPKGSPARGVVLVRSERVGAHPVATLARWLAEDGRTVVLQQCRGRGDSEGKFRPFLDEADDALATLAWLDGEASLAGPPVLFGLGYSAWTAWSASAAATERGTPIAGIAAGFGARDPYAWLYPGGVLQQEAALALAARLDGRNGHEPDALDWERAARAFDTACDRVALRELEAYREWIDHPRPDDYWRARTPAAPAATIPRLYVSGWFDPSLPALLAEPSPGKGEEVRVCLGPWGPTALARRDREGKTDPLGVVGESLLAFVARVVGAAETRPAPARVFVVGEGWREFADWPPAAAETRTLRFGASDPGEAGDAGDAGDGVLQTEPAAESTHFDFVHDPAAPPPACGGVSYSQPCGPASLDRVGERGDVLTFTGPPLTEPWVLVGPVEATLFVEARDPEAPWCVRLAAVDANGESRWLAEGVGLEGDEGRVEVSLGAVGVRVASGERLRVLISGASVGRYARAERRTPEPRALHVGATEASSLRVPVLGTIGRG
ncbi:MAG: CocE/NonD family hydrolase [Myxococcota bacterium]